MDRTAMINTVGIGFHTSNIEGGEYSYVKEAGSREELERKLARTVDHFKLDIRFLVNICFVKKSSLIFLYWPLPEVYLSYNKTKKSPYTVVIS